jgi:hypothetical protein
MEYWFEWIAWTRAVGDLVYVVRRAGGWDLFALCTSD